MICTVLIEVKVSNKIMIFLADDFLIASVKQVTSILASSRFANSEIEIRINLLPAFFLAFAIAKLITFFHILTENAASIANVLVV
jgi:hypothetical protein